MMPNLTKFGATLEVKFGVIMTLLCIVIQTVFRKNIRRYYEINMYFFKDSIHRGFLHYSVHTLVLLCLEDDFNTCVIQTHVVPGFLVLYHQKVALNGVCAGDDGRQNTNEPLQQRVRVVQSVPSILVCGNLVKAGK